MKNYRGIFTTSFGSPIDDDQNSITAGDPGPIVISDVHLQEKLAHFNRERIPERIVHAKGAGAFGYFEVTHDMTKYTKAAFLSEIGKRTEVLARFSTVGGEKGSADAERDPRGFAVKFYTEDGNYDLASNNTPVFFILSIPKKGIPQQTQKTQICSGISSRLPLNPFIRLPFSFQIAVFLKTIPI